MDADLADLMTISQQAGRGILEIYHSDFQAREKADGSAVTDADEAAEAIIIQGLKEISPDIPVLAEEAASAGRIPELGNKFWLVDPLDGTREFVNRTHEFTVNIALIENGQPKMGVVLAPALQKAWFGAVGKGASCVQLTEGLEMEGDAKAISVRPRPAAGPTAVASRSHRSPETEALLTKLGAADFKPAGSSLKFCLVAEGDADVYPRLGRTMEWDTGAGHAVLLAAGGRVHVLDEHANEGSSLTYGKADRGYDNPHFIAWGK